MEDTSVSLLQFFWYWLKCRLGKHGEDGVAGYCFWCGKPVGSGWHKGLIT